MSTAELVYPGQATVSRPRAAARRSASTVLAGALFLVVLYAAFDHGAASAPVETRVELAIAAIAAIAAGAWLWTGSLRFSAPRLALAGTALLAGFAAWSGVSVFWSLAPNQTWLELNLAIAYVIVLCLAIALGASHPRPLSVAANGFLAIALAVTAYGLGQKLIPGVHVAGLFNLNQTGPLPRLQEPLGYWNALALLVAMGIPIALARAVDRERPGGIRLAALGVIEPMLLVVAFTYSRGGLLALALALAVAIASSEARLRSLMWLAVAVVPTAAPLAFGLSDHALTTAHASLASREAAGGELAGVLVAALVAILLVGRLLLGAEGRVKLSEQRVRLVGRSLAGLAGVLVVCGLLAVAVSSRGLDGTVSHAWKSFTATRATSNADPTRLLSADSQYRWVWWKEAAGAFSDRPLTGWGAGSFPVLHLLYRRDTLTVKQPHSVPLQFLAETGVIGAVLALGGLALLLVAAVRRTMRLRAGPERLLAAALLAGAVGYLIHSLYDWDWDIPALTLPALVFLGVLVGGRSETAESAPQVERADWGVRILALMALTVGLCAFALSAELPALASSKASSALVSAAVGSPTSLRHAQSSASLSSSLDPLSDAGPLAEATIALHRSQWTRARGYLVEAVKRQPTDGQAWSELGFVEFSLGDNADAVRAGARAQALDPIQPSALTIAATNLRTAPPQDSATATPVPGR